MNTTRRSTPQYGPPAPQAKGFIEIRGETRFRCMGFVRGLKITCPDGHTIAGQSLVREDHTLVCSHRAAAGQGECGLLVYVLVFPALGNGKRRIWAADVTYDEVREMERLGLDADGVLAYFGVAFTRERAG